VTGWGIMFVYGIWYFGVLTS